MKLWDDVAEKVRKTFPTDMAGLRGRTRKDRTIREITDNGVESERDHSHLPDAQYAHPAAEDTTSLRLVQPVTRKQGRASTTPASIFQPPPPALRSHWMMIPGRQFLPCDWSPRRRFCLLETYAAMSRKMA